MMLPAGLQQQLRLLQQGPPPAPPGTPSPAGQATGQAAAAAAAASAAAPAASQPPASQLLAQAEPPPNSRDAEQVGWPRAFALGVHMWYGSCGLVQVVTC